MTSSGDGFVDVSTFAEAAGIGVRCAQKALARIAAGATWRECRLEIRKVQGPGGRAGDCYQVDIASLPLDMQARIHPPKQTELPLIVLSRADKSWKRCLVQSIMAAGMAGSSSRAEALREIGASATHPSGKRKGQPISERTLRAWTTEYERRGLAGLTRSRRADRGKDRVIVSRTWDRIMTEGGVSPDGQAKFAEAVFLHLKSLWKSGGSSASNVLFAAQAELRKIALSATPSLSREQVDKMCRLPSGVIRRDQRARLVHKKNSDAGGHAARMVPRIHRDYSELRPLEMVAADVRHSDIIVQRADGSEATMKMIAFLDLATKRVFARVHLMNKGEMIRREHVLSAFRDLFSEWGVPQQLYLDNGSEFRTGPAADDLTAVAQLVRDTHAIEMGVFDALQLPAKTGRVHSRPYNPQSKVIEGLFSNFTRSIEPMWPGFVGGNRMAKKVENQGRKKTPMPGDEAAIKAEFRTMIDLYHAKRHQRGHIIGRSPNEVFAKHVEEGWKTIVFTPGEFTLAFGNDQFRQVQAGGEFQYGGKLYRHDDLLIRVGDRIRIRVPILDAGGRIPVLDDKGQVLCVATFVNLYSFRDVEGAKEQGRQNKVLNSQIVHAGAGAPKLDIVAEIRRRLAELPAAPVAQQLATISIDPALRQASGEENAAIDLPKRLKPIARQYQAARLLREGILRAG